MMTLRLALFGLVAGVFVSVIYVITEPMIIESKEEARIKRLYSLAEQLLRRRQHIARYVSGLNHRLLLCSRVGGLRCGGEHAR